MAAPRQYAIPGVSLRGPYKVWTPPDRQTDSDSDNERFRRQSVAQVPGGHAKQGASSRGYPPDKATLNISSRGPLTSNVYQYQPSTSSQEGVADVLSSSHHVRQHAHRATTTTTTPQSRSSTGRTYLEALDPRTYLLKRSQKDKTKLASEQVSSAEESSRSSHRVPHGKSSRSTPSPFASTTTSALFPSGNGAAWYHNDQASKIVGSLSHKDMDREERARRQREKEYRYREDVARADRSRAEKVKAEYIAKSKAKAEAEPFAKGTVPERPSSSKPDLPEQRTHDYDASERLRRKTVTTPSDQRHRATQHENAGTSHTRYNQSSTQPVTSATAASFSVQHSASSAMRGGSGQQSSSTQSLHLPPIMIPTQRTTSSQSTVHDQVRSPVSLLSANVPRRITPPSTPMVFPVQLSSVEPQRKAIVKEIETDKADVAKTKDGERDKRREKDRRREQEHSSRSHRPSHRDKANSLSVYPSAVSGSESERPNRVESLHHQRAVSHSSALRANRAIIVAENNTNSAQDDTRPDSKRERNPSTLDEGPETPPKHEPSPYTKNPTGYPTISRDHQDIPLKPPDKPKLDIRSSSNASSHFSTFATSGAFPQIPVTESNVQIVSNYTSQGSSERVPSRSGQKVSSGTQSVDAWSALVTSPQSPHPYDRTSRPEIVSRVPTASPGWQSQQAAPTTSSRTHIVSGLQPSLQSHTASRSDMNATTALGYPSPISPISSAVQQIAPTPTSFSGRHQLDSIRSPDTRASQQFLAPHNRSSAIVPQSPVTSQSIPVTRTPSNNSQVPESSHQASNPTTQFPRSYSTPSTLNPLISPVSSHLSAQPSTLEPHQNSRVAYNASSRNDVPATNQPPYLDSSQTYPQSPTYQSALQSSPMHVFSAHESITTLSHVSSTVYKSTSSQSPDPSFRSPKILGSGQAVPQSFAQAMSSRPPSYDKGAYLTEALSSNREPSLTVQSPTRDPQALYLSPSSKSQQVELPTSYHPPVTPTLPPMTSRSQSYATRTIPATSTSQSTFHPAVSSPPALPLAMPTPSLPTRSQTYPLMSIASQQSIPSTTPVLSVPPNASLSTRVTVPGRPSAFNSGRTPSQESPPSLSLSSSPDSYEEILMTPASLAPIPKSSQPKRPEEPKKKGLLSLFRSSSKSSTTKQHEVWHPSTSGSSGRRENNSKSSVSVVPLAIDTGLLQQKLARPVPIPIPIPASGRKSPARGFAPLRLFGSKRHRTVSTASLEALDGTANNTVVGSPTASMKSTTPGRMTSPSPPLRDPYLATQEWRNKEEKDLTIRGAQRRRRPGVTFDLSEEEVPPSSGGHRPARARRT